MLSILAIRTYRHLFLAQVIALIGTGLATVALGLLAWEIAGANAGLVLGTALAIKMVAYVSLAPIAQAFADRVPRKVMLVSLDLIRAIVALALPFVSEVWQIYLLIFVLQAASAGFTPTFQATIPDILPDEADYTRALSLSRLAYDLESLLSPMLAAALLTIVSFPVLFGGTVLGFLCSALLVVSAVLPSAKPAIARGIWDRTTRGLRIYLATPRLRGLLALNLSVAAAASMVFVNTIVIVKDRLGLGEEQLALALAAFGAGSMIAALVLPRLLERIADRPPMIAGACLLTICMMCGPYCASFASVLVLWFAIGVGYSLTQTPSGRLLRRSAHAEDRPSVFAAQFALSHACWLIAYPLAGRFGAAMGIEQTYWLMAILAFAGVLGAFFFWPAREPKILPHTHPDLPLDHPHIKEHGAANHQHAVVIDDLHWQWPQGKILGS